MRKLVIGCAVAGLIVLSPKSEARFPVSADTLPGTLQMMPVSEVGTASWYGFEREGKPTASGELFDSSKLTAAHRVLPLGTTVRVTNLTNLKSTILLVTDRGPGIDSRVIDVSRAAAKRLGFLDVGLAQVEIEVVRYPEGYIWQRASANSPAIN